MKKLIHFALKSTFVVLMGLGMIGLSPHSANAQTCCTANGGTGCEDAGCQAAICSLDSWCCTNDWDSICATAATDNANGGGACDGVSDCPSTGGGGTCCQDTDGTPGCAEAPACEALICGLDPFCCDTSWDATCATAAAGNCGAAECDPPPPVTCCQDTDGTPGCAEAPACESLICGLDPFCCNTSWDATCATAAAANCGETECAGGPEPAGPCCDDAVSTGTPECEDAGCTAEICAGDAFCCDNTWDTLCAADAITNAEGGGACEGVSNCPDAVPPAGPCCDDAVSTGTPECEDAGCTAEICAGDAFCCDNTWDTLCAADAIINATGGGACADVSNCPPAAPIAGPCCDEITSTGTPECEDVGCTAEVCAVDAFCCDNSWDTICAGLAVENANASGACGGVSNCPLSPPACCSANGGLGCGDAGCEAAICADDPFCCDTSWDATCASAAVDNANAGGACDGVTDCPVAVPGCIDPLATNFDALATYDDGSCVYPPANNDCADAQSIGTTPYPGTTSSLGDLQGATASGGAPSCYGGVDSFFDVFYEITVSDENHFIVNVNPLGNFTPYVEVLDACGGTVIDCETPTGIFCDQAQGSAGFPGDPTCEAAVCGDDPFCCDTEWDGLCATSAAEDFPGACSGCLSTASLSMLLENLTAGTYTIRVGTPGTEPNLSSSPFLINVQSFPTAQVQDNPNSTLYACNQGGFQLEDFVGADPQTSPGLGILDYEWLAAEEGGGTQTVYQRGSANYVARCEWLGMEYGTTYNTFVRLLIDHPEFGPTWGVFQGDYQSPNLPGASACTISTSANVTPTELLPSYTPNNAQGNNYALCDFAIAYNVSESENFRWRFDPDLDPNNGNEIFYTRGTGNPSVRLSWVNGLVPGLTYNVAVEVQVAGQWSGYSTVLPLTMALTPNDVEVRSSFCGGTYAPNGYILSESVCDADLYQFRFTPVGGGTPSFRNSGNYVCFMSAANPSLTPGDYDVQVKVTQNGVPGDWGPACTITIAGPQGQVNDAPVQRNVEEVGSAMLFPNPNAGEEVRVNLDGLSDGNHEVMIQVYDVYGKLISTEWFGHEGNSLSRLVSFDGNLSMGMYMVQITVDGDRFATERLIVK